MPTWWKVKALLDWIVEQMQLEIFPLTVSSYSCLQVWSPPWSSWPRACWQWRPESSTGGRTRARGSRRKQSEAKTALSWTVTAKRRESFSSSSPLPRRMMRGCTRGTRRRSTEIQTTSDPWTSWAWAQVQLLTLHFSVLPGKHCKYLIMSIALFIYVFTIHKFLYMSDEVDLWLNGCLN